MIQFDENWTETAAMYRRAQRRAAELREAKQRQLARLAAGSDGEADRRMAELKALYESAVNAPEVSK